MRWVAVFLGLVLEGSVVAYVTPGRADAAKPEVNLVIDGDSISAGAGSTQGHGLDVLIAASVGSPVRLRNVAVSGRPVHECLRLYPTLVAPLFRSDGAVNLIVFHAGDNDINQDRDADQTYQAFTAYVAAAHRQGWRVVVSTELRVPRFNAEKAGQLEKYNSMLRANRAGADAVVDLDTDPRMTDMSRRADPLLFSPDGIHPSNGGYEVLAGMLVPAVRRVAGR